MIGGALLGITGALIDVPAAAAVQLVLQQVVYPARDTARTSPWPRLHHDPDHRRCR